MVGIDHQCCVRIIFAAPEPSVLWLIGSWVPGLHHYTISSFSVAGFLVDIESITQVTVANVLKGNAGNQFFFRISKDFIGVFFLREIPYG
ncbi:hypothetical protein D3C84_1142270 [compost metagenome]